MSVEQELVLAQTWEARMGELDRVYQQVREGGVTLVPPELLRVIVGWMESLGMLLTMLRADEARYRGGDFERDFARVFWHLERVRGWIADYRQTQVWDDTWWGGAAVTQIVQLRRAAYALEATVWLALRGPGGVPDSGAGAES